jgi:DNA invertase Pin-like site-specific DNA recombinase
MRIGYARVSTQDQNLDLQTDALKREGCEKIYQEKMSATVEDRPALQEMGSHLREGDTVIVWKLDRLARSLKHLLTIVSGFQTAGIGFISLQDQINTTTAQGRLVFNIFASLSEFEREIIKERTLAGLEAARKRGRTGGRKPGLSKEAKVKAAAVKHLYVDENKSLKEICEAINISRATIYHYLDYLKVDRGVRKARVTQTQQRPDNR